MKNKKIYHYYDLDNERRTINLDESTQIIRIRDDHCKFCGCLMAVYDGDPHYVIGCPSCGSHYESMEEGIKDLESQMHMLIRDLDYVSRKLLVFQRKNAVYEKNIKNVAETRDH
jgi:uncharacterized Zn finger protein (UPF0148 family)